MLLSEAYFSTFVPSLILFGQSYTLSNNLAMKCFHVLLLSASLLWVTESSMAQNDNQVLGDPVFTPEEIADGAAVTFLIRFQNFSTDTALQVVVRDTLDPRFDAATFEMVAASHPYELLHDAGSLVVRWYFTDINLPPAITSGNGSLGFVLFRVKPKPFLAPDQVIPHRAWIYFDQTSPVLTNTTYVWIDEGASLTEADPGATRYNVVPNPNYGHFEVRQEVASSFTSDTPSASWWITDYSGRTVWDGRADDAQSIDHQVRLDKPAPGLYLLWVKEKGKLQVQQFAVLN